MATEKELEEGNFHTENPISLAAEADRETTVNRFEDDESKQFVRSTPDALLMLDETGELWAYSYAVTFLQLFTSVALAVSVFTDGVHSKPNPTTFIVSFAASVAIASSIHNSTLEMWVNNACIELLKKELPEDQLVQKKDGIMTLYYISQLAFGFATVFTIAQQRNAVDIITNATGLMLVQDLDRGLFSCMQIPAKGSHKMKEKLSEVVKDPKYSSRAIFQGSLAFIYVSIAIIMAAAQSP